jgi:galactokinase
MKIHQSVRVEYEKRFGEKPSHISRAPGRVNLLGEHVDYNNGMVIPAAINLSTWIAFSLSGTDKSTLVALDLEKDEIIFDSKSLQARADIEGKNLSDWAKYPAGIAWALQKNGLVIPGMKAVLSSNVPRGAGLSSSASVEMAFGTAWQALGGWNIPPIQLALIGQQAENQYVGMNCGIMDQISAVCGEKDQLLLLDCRSLEYLTLPLPEKVAIVIADTSVRRNLISSAYNKRRESCEEAVRLLQQKIPEITSLRDISLQDFNKYADILPEEIQMRARHVVEEMERTTRAIPLLEEGDIKTFGKLMNECHVSLRDLFGVSGPELDLMARIAQTLPGCYGARQTGAGFAGCTVNLVEKEFIEEFSVSLTSLFEKQTRLHPEIYFCQASKGAELIE